MRGDLFQSPVRSLLRLARSAAREVREHCDLVMDQYLRYARERVTTWLTLATLARLNTSPEFNEIITSGPLLRTEPE